MWGGNIIEQLTSALAGRYTIERELGAGGMATVYLADDVKHERKVAVKVLRPELSAVLGGERFLNEIKVTANLQHPHILPLFDSGAEGGDVMPDDQAFIFQRAAGRGNDLVVVLNWLEELEERVGK